MLYTKSKRPQRLRFHFQDRIRKRIDAFLPSRFALLPNRIQHHCRRLGIKYQALRKEAEDTFMIKYDEIKGWNRHKEMTLNLVVPMGSVTFIIYDDREKNRSNGTFLKVELSPSTYARLTVPPGLWLAFKGNDANTSLILNIASMAHNPDEIEKLDLNKIPYNWESN